jgi:hypothetical protein
MAYTNLNLPRLADVALQQFVKELLPLSVFSTNFSPDNYPAKHKGQGILVPLVGTLTATTFGGTYAITTFAKSVITVTINRHKLVPIGETDLDAANNSDSSLESMALQAGAALAQAVLEDVLTLVTTANFAAIGTAVSSTVLDVPGLRSGKLALNQANAPKPNRCCIMDSVGMDALLAVTNFVQAYMFADNNVLKEGRVMRALGMDLFDLNASFVAAASVNCFFAHASAIAVAMRYLQPQRPENYDFAEQFSDARTGITMGLRDYYDPLTGTRYLAIEANYGYSAGITNGGRILKRTD